MGFSYSAFGLCCDFCDHDKSDRLWIKKIKCPYNFCQSWAVCDQCHKLKKHLLSSCTNKTLTHRQLCKRLDKKLDLENKLNDLCFIDNNKDTKNEIGFKINTYEKQLSELKKEIEVLTQ